MLENAVKKYSDNFFLIVCLGKEMGTRQQRGGSKISRSEDTGRVRAHAYKLAPHSGLRNRSLPFLSLSTEMQGHMIAVWAWEIEMVLSGNKYIRKYIG